MKNKYLNYLFPIALILALTLSMIGTRSVLADDVPPTPTDEVSTETPPTEEPVSTEEPVLTEESASTEEPASTPENPEETVPEIMEQLPDGTTLIVLEDGEPLPLVSNEAAAALITGDPQWCPDGDTPGTDALDSVIECTIAHPSFSDLINDLTTNSGTYFGSGTIYVAYDYDASTAGDAGSDIIFDYGDVGLTDLVVQGGWNFVQDKVIGTSTIDLGFGNSLEFWDWGGYGVPGSLTLKDLIITNSDGLYIGWDNDTTTADVTLENVDVIDTDWGAYIETEGNVEITNSSFNDTQNDSGLAVYSDGNITIASVHASGNYENGAELYNDCGCLISNIFVSSSVFELNGNATEGRGLIAHSIGDITLRDVSVSMNGGGGAELINCFFDFFGSNTCLNTNPGEVTVTGTNNFQNNGYNPPQFLGGGPYASVGLWIGSNGDVSVDGVTVTGNGAGNTAGGALIFTENGTMSISNSTFSDNCTTFYCDMGFGLIAINLLGSGTTLNNTTANGNGNGDGSTYNSALGIGTILVNMSGNAFVKNSTFSNNCNYGSCSAAGLLTLSAGNVYFNFVNANNNGSASGGGGGAQILAGGNVDIYCSTFNNNQSVGLAVTTPGDLTLNGVTFTGNIITDFDPTFVGGTLTVNPFDCAPAGKGNVKPHSDLPLKLVKVNSGDSIGLDCENFSGTKLVLENGDHIVVPCPLGGSASLTEQLQTGLPSPLPDGSVFRSGFVSVIDENGNGTGTLSGSVLISFVIPEGVDASELAILYWDGTQWVEVEGTFTLNEDGITYFAAYVNYTGTFVLVQR